MDRVLNQLAGCNEPGVKVIMATGALASSTTGFTAASQKGKFGTFARTGVGTGKFTLTNPCIGFAVPILTLSKATAEALEIEVVSYTASTGVLLYRLVVANGTTETDPTNALQVNLLMFIKDSGGI